MPIYKIADVLVEVSPRFEYTKDQMSDYLYTNGEEKTDFSVVLKKEDLIREYELVPNYAVHYYESIAIYRKICNEILKNYNGMFFHCSALAMNNKAYLFTAPSGTGKSTHSRMWRETFGNKVTMINDDKPIIRLIDGTFYVYGTPWDGKHSLSSNVKVPIGAICILERGEENSIERVCGTDYLSAIMNQTIVPKDTETLNKFFDISEKLLKEIPIYTMKCNISHEAAIMAYNAMK